MKRLSSTLIALPMMITFLSGCSGLHIHTIDSPWESNESSHWKTCKVCHEKFDEHEHVFNSFEDKCFVCDYVDPLVYVDENNVMTGLTPYGKTKLTFNVPHHVKGIAAYAFKDSNVLTVKLNKELNFRHKDAFEESQVKLFTTEEDEVKWIKDGDIFIKERVLDNNVAKINNDYYPTLAAAFASVTTDDVTITLLRDELKVDEPISVMHPISLVSFYSSAKLICDFNISTGGILYIPETITYEGTTKLLIDTVSEERGRGDDAGDGNVSENVYTSGSLVFTHKKERPNKDKVHVSYVRSLKDAANEYPAFGAKQIVNDLVLLLPADHFAFGTFRFDSDFKQIKGLTKYGETVSELNITKVIDREDYNNSSIGNRSFTIALEVEIPTALDPVVFNFFASKGTFTKLYIGEGIKTIGEAAFNERVNPDITDELIKYISIVFSHVLSLTLGPDVEEIGRRAFFESVSLASIGGGANLKKIGTEAFGNCFGLKTVELSDAKNLETINPAAFKNCTSLVRMNIPQEGGWKYDNHLISYFPYDLTPEYIAHLISQGGYFDKTWTRNPQEQSYPISYTSSNSKDDLGRYNNVKYTNNIAEAISSCVEDGEIYLSEKFSGTSISDPNIGSKNLTIAADSKLNVTIDDGDGVEGISIDPGKYLTLSNVKPSGDVTLKANSDGTTQHFKNTAGLATRGVNLDELGIKVKVENDMATPEGYEMEAVDASIDERNCRAYGLCAFNVGTEEVTVTNLSNLGQKASFITINRQIKQEQPTKAVLSGIIWAPPEQYNTNLTNVVLSDEVESISVGFFTNCVELREITCGKGIKTITDRMFMNIPKLETVNFSTTIEAIGTYAFANCSNLISFSIPDGIKTIPSNCFYGCSSLTSIVIPDSVEEIADGAFNGCKSLKEVTFGDNVKTIGKEAFRYCESLLTLELPGELTSIGTYAFSNCTYLTSVYLPIGNKLNKIGGFAFLLTNLSSFRFSDNTIGWKAGATSLESDILSDESEAAMNLRSTHNTQEWTREI